MLWRDFLEKRKPFGPRIEIHLVKWQKGGPISTWRAEPRQGPSKFVFPFPPHVQLVEGNGDKIPFGLILHA